MNPVVNYKRPVMNLAKFDDILFKLFLHLCTSNTAELAQKLMTLCYSDHVLMINLVYFLHGHAHRFPSHALQFLTFFFL